MFTQFKSMVASAVTQDPIYEYKVDDKSMFLCGRNEIFRVKSAIEISSGKEVSIFQIKMADLVARQDPSVDTTFFLDRVRHHVTLLSQLRHPGILRVERGVVEVPGKKLWFVTERVKAWVPHLPLNEIPHQLRVLGLRRCAETLRFVHETADMMMVDLSPQSLFVTQDGRWKFGDFIHAMRRTEMLAESDAGVVSVLCTPSHSFRSVGAPLLDYVAAEFVDFLTKSAPGGGARDASSQPLPLPQSKGPSLADLMGGGGDLFGSQPSQPQGSYQHTINTSAPLGFPDSDVYSFLLTTVEVLNGGKKLFNCAGSLERHQSQRDAVGKSVEEYFPRGALSHRPRPPMSTVMATGPFATEDMQMLDQIERYDTLDSTERFALLKALYMSIGPPPSRSAGGVNDFDPMNFGRQATGTAANGKFCEPVIIENILPLMKRESKQQSMLRFVLPIMLQSCYVLSAKAFDEELREYFSVLISAMIKAKPPWYEKVGLLAQLMLEKFDILCQQMNTREDKTQTLMPFLMKCLYTDGSGDDEALLGLALNAMRKLFDSGNESAVAALVPTNDAAASLAGKLTDIGATHATLFTSAFLCLEKILVVSSTTTKEATETHLIQALRQMGNRSSSNHNNSNSGTSASGNGGVSGETREMQIRSMMTTLQKLEDGFSREHAASKSIPQLSLLLLSPQPTIRSFTVQAIDKHMAPFRTDSTDVFKPAGVAGVTSFSSAAPHASLGNRSSGEARKAPAPATTAVFELFNSTPSGSIAPSTTLAPPTRTNRSSGPTSQSLHPSAAATVGGGGGSSRASAPASSSVDFFQAHTSTPAGGSGAAPAWTPPPSAANSTIHFTAPPVPPPTVPPPSSSSSLSPAYPPHSGGVVGDRSGNTTSSRNNNASADFFASMGL